MNSKQLTGIFKGSCFLWITCLLPMCFCTYKIDDTSGLGRNFDGIGAISGGGVSFFLAFLIFSFLSFALFFLIYVFGGGVVLSANSNLP